MAREFYSIDQVLKELQIEKEELDRMIEEGEMRAFPDGGKIKFLKNDVEYLKNSKMDQPTITVSAGDEVQVIEEIEDDFEDEDEESVSEATPPPLFSMGKEDDDSDGGILGEKEFNFEDTKIELKPETTEKPLLDIHEDPQDMSGETAYEAISAETSELQFEHSNEDELLETGELLFDSKVDDRSSKDKEFEELFTESEMGLSGLDSKVDSEYRPVADFGSDDIVGSTIQEKAVLAIDESKRTQKVKTFGGIIAAVCAFAVIAVFILYNKQIKYVVPKTPVKVYKVVKTDVFDVCSFKSILKSQINTTINSNTKGKIKIISKDNVFVKKRDVIAKIVSEDINAQNDIDKLKPELEEKEKKYNKLKDYLKKYKNDKKAFLDYLGVNKNVATYIKLIMAAKRKKISRSEFNKKRSEIKPPVTRDLLSEAKRLYGPYKKSLPVVKEYGPEEKRLKAECELLGKKLKEKEKQRYNEFEVIIENDGFLKKWEVADGEDIESGKVLCSFMVEPLVVEFVIPEKDSKNWKLNEEITLKHNNEDVIAEILKVERDTSTLPISIKVVMSIKEDKINPGESLKLEYKNKMEGIAIPKEAIRESGEGTFVYIFKYQDEHSGDGKAYKKYIKRKKYTNGNLVSVTDLRQGELVIVSSGEKSLTDKMSVKLKKEGEKHE